MTKKILLGVLTSIMIFSYTSCAKKAIFLASTVVPAAEGVVKVKRDKNKNYAIKINISNLAEVTKLQTSKQTYVVWMSTNQDQSKNIGRLTSKTSFLTKKLKASFKAISAAKPVKIFITAENDGATQIPDGQFVLSTNIF